MNHACLLVPVYVDGLCLPQGRAVNGPLVDFRRLPYVGRDASGLADTNADAPWLGSVAAREPMAGCDGWLPAGVHLHWALPDALAHARRRGEDPDRISFRAAPNRWLVTRWRGEALQRRWLVESDYLWPDHQVWTDSLARGGAGPGTLVSYLLPPSLREAGTPPWRYMGRRLDLDRGERPGPADRYLGALTAVGYGDSHFAAYYPSCRSVFGLHDPETTAPAADLRYEVYGWYARGGDDPLDRAPSDGTFATWLRDELGWRADKGGPARRTLCVGRILGSALDGPERAVTDVTVALAENHVESVSAVIGSALADRRPASQTERFLEALLVADDLSKDTIDLGPRTDAALHARSFLSTMSDPIWAVRVEASERHVAGAREVRLPGPDQLAESAEPILPDYMAYLLNELNRVQRERTREEGRLSSLRQALYRDWCRGQLSAYPPSDLVDDWLDAVGDYDVDLVRRWLESERIAPLEALTREISGLPPDLDPVALALGSLKRSVEAYNASVSSATERWVVVQTQGPRYSVPAPPSVAVVGLADGESDRHHADGAGSADGTLSCTALAALDLDALPTAGPLSLQALAALRAALNAPGVAQDGAGLRRKSRLQPLFLEWKAELAPFITGNTIDPHREALDPELVREHFLLGTRDTEIRRRAELKTDALHSSTLRGRGAIARGVHALVNERLEAWLSRRLDAKPALRAAAGLAASGQTGAEPAILAFARSNLANVRTFFEATDPVHIALDAWEVVARRAVVTQSLAGFHESMLMLRQEADIGIDDPLAFDESRAFSRVRVAGLVGSEHPLSPVVDTDFLPIRTGDLGLTGLDLVDTWGRPTALPTDRVVTSTRLRSGGLLPVALPVRITQPSRLSLRWLDAARGQEEMSTHPTSSPICGWLLPDMLDGSIQVYDAEGRTMGSVDWEGLWRVAPGPDGGAIRPADLPNPYLVRVVQWLVGRTPDEMGALMDAIESALDHIAPPASRHAEGRALLVGRPIAVVRIRANLELAEPYATDQSMIVFSRTLSAWGGGLAGAAATGHLDAPNPTRGFEHVRFPIRIGEHARLNDGVVGYWLERSEDGSFQGDMLFAPQSRGDFDATDHIDAYEESREGDYNIWHSLADPPITATLLMDPRAQLHAASGVLPGKTLTIPKERYARALQAIGVTFPVGPLLTSAEHLEMTLPEVPGSRWYWVANEGGRWRRTARDASVERAVIDGSFSEIPDMWHELLAAGWLKPSTGQPERAWVVDVNRRPPLGGALAAHAAAIERVLDASARSIGAPATDARFPPGLSLRDGWLQLTND